MPRPASGTGAGEPLVRGQESRREGWSSRVLHRNIGSQYYFRLLQSQVKQPVTYQMHSLTAPLQDNLEYIKNPVAASEFLGFSNDDSNTEKTLEGRQQHVHTDIDDYYIFPGVLQLHAQVLLPDRPQDAPDYATGRRADGLW